SKCIFFIRIAHKNGEANSAALLVRITLRQSALSIRILSTGMTAYLKISVIATSMMLFTKRVLLYCLSILLQSGLSLIFCDSEVYTSIFSIHLLGKILTTQ